MSLELYAAAISAETPRGIAVTSGYLAANSKEEAEGIALRMARELWPETTSRDYKASVAIIPEDFCARAGYIRTKAP